MVWVYTARTNDSNDITIEVYDTHAAACDRLKKEVTAFFNKPWDDIKEIKWTGRIGDESLWINADHTEYYSGYCEYYWDVNEREVQK